MPELPEVELVTRQLRRAMLGATVVGGRSYAERFQRIGVDGRTKLPPLPLGLVTRVWRHGKWMFVRLDCTGRTRYVQLHLGMSGRFFVVPSSHARREEAHNVKWTARFRDKHGDMMRVVYVDPRGFGHLRSIPTATGETAAGITAGARGIASLGLGPDMLSEVFTRTPAWRRISVLKNALDTAVPIKVALMDQSRLAGLGNIYASEACFRMHTHPRTPANLMTIKQLDILSTAIPAMLQRSIDVGGTSLGDANSYKDVSSVEGNNANNLYVYAKANKPCKICKTPISKITMAGRATYFCPRCQPEIKQ